MEVNETLLLDLLDELIISDPVNRYNAYTRIVAWVGRNRFLLLSEIKERLEDIFSDLDRKTAYFEVERFLGNYDTYLNRALSSVQNFAFAILRSPRIESLAPLDVMADNRNAPSDVLRLKVIAALKAEAREGLVIVRGETGRTRRFSLNYYLSLINLQIIRSAETRAFALRQQQRGNDLVQVSPNPSLNKDFCDKYAGKIYSLSGRDSKFPPLSSIPNGGPPFHPNCRHSLLEYNDEV